ncbi:MAG: potassium channel family protein [Candidatus Micrarchaeales archaeon]
MRLTQAIPFIVFLIFAFSTTILYLDGVPLIYASYWVIAQIVGQYVLLPIQNFYNREDVILLSTINFFAYLLLLAFASSYFYSYFSTLKLGKMLDRFKIKRLKNHVIVCISDNFGLFLAKELKQRGVPFVIIERKKRREETSEYLTIDGIPSDRTTLEEAGIRRASIVCAISKDKFENVGVIVTAKALHPKIYAIARADSMEEMQRLYRCGADSVIIPEINGAYELAKEVLI